MSAIKKYTGTVAGFDGTPIYYEMRGEGRPVFLAYGIVCLINHWHKQIEHFSKHYKTIVIDYRGHHKTPIPADLEHLTIDAIAQDVKSVCDHLGVGKASFWSHSFGAPVLFKAYDRFPEIFDNLVLINGFATNPFKNMLGLDLSNMFQFIQSAYQRAPETLSYIWKSLLLNPLTTKFMGLSGGFNLDLTSVTDIEIYLRGVAAIDFEVFTRLSNEMVQYNATPVIERINVPTLIIGGTKDNVTPLHLQEALHKRIKNSQMTVVPYGSHCSQLDMPDLVNLRIEKFLRELNYF